MHSTLHIQHCIGVGPAKAISLIRQYKSIEEILKQSKVCHLLERCYNYSNQLKLYRARTPRAASVSFTEIRATAAHVKLSTTFTCVKQ